MNAYDQLIVSVVSSLTGHSEMTTVAATNSVPPYTPCWAPGGKGVALSMWVEAVAVPSPLLHFFFIPFAILKLITKGNYSVISPVLSGPCSEFGATWSGRKAPKSCRVVLGPAERPSLAAPSASASTAKIQVR